MQWLKQMLGALAPMSSESLGLTERIHYAWLYARMSAHNWSNEQLLMETVTSGAWSEFKFFLFLLCALLLLMVSGRGTVTAMKEMPVESVPIDTHKPFVRPGQLGWWLLSFWMCAMVFGKRMGAHHYAAWLPLFYLLLAFVVADLYRRIAQKWAQSMLVILMWVVVALNQQQQLPFFMRLAETGGVGKTTNAINRLADDAMTLPSSVVHVFPDWGFMTPFNLLTGNQRRYELDLSDATISRLKMQGNPVRIVYWSKFDTDRHSKVLEDAGYKVIRTDSYFRRDHQPAFWFIDAELK